MASRDLLRRMIRHPNYDLSSHASAVLKSRRYNHHYIFTDHLKENNLMRETPWVQKGKQYFISTVTKYYTGEVVDCDCDFIVLKKAAWIPDTGRFNEAMATGQFSEVEPYPDDMEVAVSMNSVVDICDWSRHKLPRTTK